MEVTNLFQPGFLYSTWDIKNKMKQNKQNTSNWWVTNKQKTCCKRYQMRGL